MSISCVTRSRVTPAVGSTMASRLPASQLKMLDLPTLGRPTMTTCGIAISLYNSGHRREVPVARHKSRVAQPALGCAYGIVTAEGGCADIFTSD